MPGLLRGKAGSTRRSASVPPVDVPMAMILLVVSASALWRLTGRAAEVAEAVAARRSHADLRGGLDLVGQLQREVADLVGSTWLAQDLDGTDLQRFEGERPVGLRERRDDHGRHRVVLHELAQERDPVHARHLDIERDHVGLELDDLRPRDVRIAGDAHDLDVGVARELALEDLANDGGVVDDQDADFAHASSPPAPSA